jgi:hypothetical protein
MKKANEMRVIAEAEVERIIQKKKNKAADLVEGTISNLIDAAATMGYFNIRYHVEDEGVDIEYAIELMRSFGYAIDRSGRHLAVRW